MNTNEPWRIQLLGGPLSAQHQERILTRFSTQKTGALLAFLAYHRDQAHQRDVLIELLWPEVEPAAGRARLSVALSSLRHQMEPPGTPTGAVIQADRFSVRLNPDTVTTDVAAFQATLKRAAQAQSTTERLQALSAAANLYLGPLLPGFYEDWITGEQERLAGLYFEAINNLIAHLEEAGDLGGALEYARQAIRQDPVREEMHQSLMRLLAAAGQPGAALRQYKEIERLLDEQVGEEPSAALRTLARQIERQSGLSGPLPVPLPRVFVQPATPPWLEPGQPRTMTFLLTDIEGSTRLWEREGDAFKTALEEHHRLLRGQFARHGGQEIKEAGDSFLIAFSSTRSALACAVASQQTLAARSWPEVAGSLSVRMALHTGDVTLENGEYHGLALHRASRILTAAHGGQILLSEAMTALVQRDLPEEVRLQDLGIFRLRDVPSPERLFQVEYPGMVQHQFPPLVAEQGHEANLPVQFTRFFGREEELERLSQMLLLPQTRLVTITGAGGTGKTRLALEVAARLVESLEGAVWFVELADLREADLIADTVVDVLRTARSPGKAPLDVAAEALSGYESPLLILDNFEHLVEKGAPILQALLARAQSLRCLVTSRQVLSLAGEREFVLGPLPTPNGVHSLESLSLFESVQLFVDRAQAVRPDFAVTSATAPAVAQLCDALEGIPLAIELAAARAQVLTPSQMLSQIGHRFDFLVGRRRGASERQRTLRATLDWSYRLLSPALQRFFARLSVFRGGWSVEAAEFVGEEPLALDYLAQLRECSLVLSEEVTIGGRTEMRFRMLETLREYADERLVESGMAEVVRTHHQAWFLLRAEQTEPNLNGSEQALGLDLLETEGDNLRAALAGAQEGAKGSAEHAQTFLRLAAALALFWSIRGHLYEGRTWLKSVLGQELSSPSTEMRNLRAEALRGAGNLAWFQGDFVMAESLLEEALALKREVGSQQDVAHLLTGLANVAADQGDYAVARARHEEALEVHGSTGSGSGAAGSQGDLGNVATKQGDYAMARHMLEEALASAREIGDKQVVSRSLGYLGVMERSQGNHAAAWARYEEALAVRREIGDTRSVAIALNNLGNLAKEQGDHVAARSLLEEGLTLAWKIGDKWTTARLLESFASLATASTGTSLPTGKEGPDFRLRAIRLFAAAESLRTAIGTPLDADELDAHDREITSVRADLDFATFAAAWSEGKAMTLEQAVAFALQEDRA